MFAVRAGDLASAELLVAAGADVNIEFAYGIGATASGATSKSPGQFGAPVTSSMTT